MRLNDTLRTLLVMAAAVFPFHAQAQSFHDDFITGTLNHELWRVANYPSPDSKPGINEGKYTLEAIDLSQGVLRIAVTQQRTADGIKSYGGAIISNRVFGYGTFDFEIRMSSTSTTPDGPGEVLTGAVSSAFLYLTDSQTEVDLEFLGNENAIHVTTWHGLRSKQTDKISNPTLGSVFHKYTLVWMPGSVKLYIDGTLVVSHHNDVPTMPAHIVMQNRGTNSNQWGGAASANVNRYAFFKSVNYTPMVKP